MKWLAFKTFIKKAWLNGADKSQEDLTATILWKKTSSNIPPAKLNFVLPFFLANIPILLPSMPKAFVNKSMFVDFFSREDILPKQDI